MNEICLGFMFKYICSRLEDNQLGIRGFIGDGNLKDYYDDKSWAVKGTRQLTSKVDGLEVPLKISTNALSGEESRVYKVDIHISG